MYFNEKLIRKLNNSIRDLLANGTNYSDTVQHLESCKEIPGFPKARCPLKSNKTVLY